MHRETFGSALDLGSEVLDVLGLPAAQVQRAAKIFRDYDEAALRDMATVPETDAAYSSRARQHIENLNDILRADRESSAAASE